MKLVRFTPFPNSDCTITWKLDEFGQWVLYRVVKDTIESQQQEIEELKKSDASKEQSSIDYYNLSKQLQQEIEQLKQANGNLASAAIEKPPYKNDLIEALRLASEALREASCVISSLQPKRGAGGQVMGLYDTNQDFIYDALTVIDKALGGNDVQQG
jgi:FtsZ-binding cell division protein ZapB